MNSDEAWGAGDVIMAATDTELVKVIISLGNDKWVCVWATLEDKALHGGNIFNSMTELLQQHTGYVRIGSFTYDCMHAIEKVMVNAYREGRG